MLLSLACVLAASAKAEDIYYLNQSQSGFNLPGVSLPQGQDEVRAADGTTCRSAVGGSGAYLDVGAINGSHNRNGDVATYGRVVIPLGRGGKRLNCAELYDLEIARLRAELKLLQMGLDGRSTGAGAEKAAPAGGRDSETWANTGWSDGSAKRKQSSDTPTHASYRQPRGDGGAARRVRHHPPLRLTSRRCPPRTRAGERPAPWSRR